MEVCAGDNDSASRTSAPEQGREVSLSLAQPPSCCAGCALPGPWGLSLPAQFQAVIPSPVPGRADGNESSSGSSSFFLVPFPGHREGCTYVIQAQYICAYRKLLWCLCEKTVTYSGCNELSWGAAKSLQAVAAMHRCKMQTEAAGTAFIQPLALPS